MDLSAILNPEPSTSTTRSVQALDQPGLILPSIEEILPSHEFRRLMQRRTEEQMYEPVTDMNDPRAARFLGQIQVFRTKWEQVEWHQLNDGRGFRFDLCFWRSYHTFLLPIDGKRRRGDVMTQNATVQSPAHHSATRTKSAEMVENAGGTVEKAWGQSRARTDAQVAKYEKFNGDMERLKQSATDISASRSKKEEREACSTPEIAATSPPPLTQPLVSNQATVPTPQWAIKYQPGNLPLLGLEPGKWGDDITAYAPGKMPRPGRACARDPFSTDPSLKFEWNWGLFTLLARIPGGRAKLDVLYQMCVEWCPAVNLKSHNNKEKKEKKNSTCRHSLSQNDCFISEDKMWRLANIGETKVKKPGPEKNKNPTLTWKKRRPEKATSGAKRSKSQRHRRSTINYESPSLHSTLLISSFEPSPENAQHFEHLVPTNPDHSQLSTWVSSPSQPSPGKIQSPSAKLEALVVAEHDQGDTQVPEMAKSLTSPGPQFKPRYDRSSPPARARRRLLPPSMSKDAHEVNDQQDNTPEQEMVLSLPVCSAGFRCPGPLEKKMDQQENNPDQEMVNGAAFMLSLSTVGFKAINSSSSGFTPINTPSGVHTTKRKLEDGNDVSEQAATRRRIG